MTHSELLQRYLLLSFCFLRPAGKNRSDRAQILAKCECTISFKIADAVISAWAVFCGNFHAYLSINQPKRDIVILSRMFCFSPWAVYVYQTILIGRIHKHKTMSWQSHCFEKKFFPKLHHHYVAKIGFCSVECTANSVWGSLRLTRPTCTYIPACLSFTSIVCSCEVPDNSVWSLAYTAFFSISGVDSRIPYIQWEQNYE